MRALALLLFLLITGAIVLFALENRDPMTLKFYNWQVTAPTAWLIGGVYVLGMLTGSSLIGAMRRSFERATESRERSSAAAR